MPFEHFDKEFVILEVMNDRQLINFELLIIRGSRIIKSPLFKGDMFADKI